MLKDVARHVQEYNMHRSHAINGKFVIFSLNFPCQCDTPASHRIRACFTQSTDYFMHLQIIIQTPYLFPTKRNKTDASCRNSLYIKGYYPCRPMGALNSIACISRTIHGSKVPLWSSTPPPPPPPPLSLSLSLSLPLPFKRAFHHMATLRSHVIRRIKVMVLDIERNNWKYITKNIKLGKKKRKMTVLINWGVANWSEI